MLTIFALLRRAAAFSHQNFPYIESMLAMSAVGNEFDSIMYQNDS